MVNDRDILVLPQAEDHPLRRRALIEQTRRRFSPATLVEGRRLVQEGQVSNVTLGSDFIEASVCSNARVVWHVLEEETLLDCSCPNPRFCEHQAALLLILEIQLPNGEEKPEAGSEAIRTVRPRTEGGSLGSQNAGPPSSVSQSSQADGPGTKSQLTVILEPWKPVIRFLLEELDSEAGEAASLSAVKILSLNEIGDLIDTRGGGWGTPDAGLLEHLATVSRDRFPPGAREWRPPAEEFSRILPVLAEHPRVFDHHGRPLRVELTGAEPSARLFMEKGQLCAEVELKHDAGGRLDPARPLQWRISGDEYCWEDPRGLMHVRQELVKTGFCAGSEGPLRLPPDRLDDWLGHQLPRWRRQGRSIHLGREVRRLLEGRRQVRSKWRLAATRDIDWFEISWRLEAGEEVLCPQDIRALRVFPGRYFRLDSGRIVAIDRGVIRRQVEALVEMGYAPTRSGPQRLPVRFVARAIDLAETGNPEDLEIDPDIQRLYRTLKGMAVYPEDSPPKALQGRLRPYQLEGYRFLRFLYRHRLGGVLADDMGLGKTLQALTLVLHLKETRAARPSLVICPTSVAENWLEEAEKFAPCLRTLQLRTGSDCLHSRFEDYDLVVMSYGLVQRFRISHRFRCLILDEAQHIKNPRAGRTKAVKNLKADFRMALTGTPIENHVTELWSLFDFLLPGLLGTATQFQRRFAKPIMKRQDESVLRLLTETVRPFILRRLKSQVAPELPNKVEQNLYCELNVRQKKLYREVAAQVRGEVSRHIEAHGLARSRIPILTALMRLRQLCCHPALIDSELAPAGSAKLAVFLEQLERLLSAGHRVLVFSQFVAMLRILRRELEQLGTGYHYLDGSTRNRGEQVRRFQQAGEQRVFLMSLKAGGTGLNLTVADYVILYDPWWNPAVEQQAIDRIHRIGQEKPVTAYRMITKGTVEEKMLELHRRKQSLAQSVLESEVGEEELLGLLEL